VSKRSLNRQLRKFSNDAQKPAGVLTSFVDQDPNLPPLEQLRLKRERNRLLEKAFRLFSLGWIQVWGGWDQNSEEEESYIVSPKRKVTDDYFERVFTALLIGDIDHWGRQVSGFIKRRDTDGVILLERGREPQSPYRRKRIHRTATREGYIGKGYTRMKFGRPGMPKLDFDSWGSTLADEMGTARDRRTFCWREDKRWWPCRLLDQIRGIET